MITVEVFILLKNSYYYYFYYYCYVYFVKCPLNTIPCRVISYNLRHREVKFQALHDCSTIFDHIDSTRHNRWAIPFNTIFCNSCKQGFPGIRLIWPSVFFFIIPNAPITTGIIVSFKCHIFCISISKSLYLLIFSYSLIDRFLSDGTVTSINTIVVIIISVLKSRASQSAVLLILDSLTLGKGYRLPNFGMNWWNQKQRYST